MWRGMLLFLIVIGLSGAGNPPNPNNEANKGEATQSAANTIARAIREVRPDEDSGCEDRKDKRSSNLCAQWKAADAANDAADYTLLAVILSALGTALVGFSLLVTVRTSRRELRAYVSVKPRGLPVFGIGEIPCATITIINGGATPAYTVEQYGAVLIDEFPLKSDPLTDEKTERGGIRGQSTLHKGDEHSAEMKGNSKTTLQDIEDIRAGRKVIYVIGNIDYRDTFRKKRRTEFCYFLDKDTLIKVGKAAVQSRADGTKTVEIKWSLGNLHTRAT
jgi:hypothetical protein